jgi:pimeloyl-ACP methyl ester carboxylesterase
MTHSPPPRALSTFSLLVALAVGLGSCADDEGEPAAGPSTHSPSSSIPTSPSTSVPVDPAATPSINRRYAIDGDRKLALVCWGEGSPTVLLETGGVNIEEWTGTAVVSALAGSSRVCTYDRAGSGRSDPAPNERRDAEDVVTESHALLEAAGLTGPLVLIGRSFGGMIVAHYAEVLPQDVVGVVVLDSPAPSAEFTPENEPELVWDFPGNIEHLDVVGGFENRFANDPPRFDAPLLVVTPVPGEGSARNERFWLPSSPHSRQVTCAGEPDAGGPCTDAIARFVEHVGN